MPSIKRAIVSVSDKTGILALARALETAGVEILSTGGTAKYLRDAGVEITLVSEVTGFPEILDGRVKTLHPNLYGGLLAVRDNPSHREQLAEHKIQTIDMVVINLYPFEKTIGKQGIALPEAIENIDIGGPCMVRAAAKNYENVTVVTSVRQYTRVVDEFKRNGSSIPVEVNRKFAIEAFRMTAKYDSLIHNYLTDTPSIFPEEIKFDFEKIQDLRYGENPHQKAALYRNTTNREGGIVNAQQLHGKELSYNNLLDAESALGLCAEFEQPVVVILKHNNPCGVGVSDDLSEAYKIANATDPVSAFGGIVGINRPVDAKIAQQISEVFTEVVLAEDFSEDALEILQAKKNLRLLKMPEIRRQRKRALELKRISGGLLVQDQDFLGLHDIELRVVTKRQPSDDEWQAMRFGWVVCKWVKSNAIVYAGKDRTIGIGAGQMSRVDSSRIAVEKAKSFGLSTEGAALASDAFFPFRDGVDIVAEAKATAIIQPGGSIRDDEVIRAADENNIAMVFTGVRHFRH